MARRKELYEELHPEAATNRGGLIRSGRAGKDETVSSFTEDASSKTGRSSRTVQHDVQIGTSITPDTEAVIADTPIEGRPSGTRDRPLDLLVVPVQPWEHGLIPTGPLSGVRQRPGASVSRPGTGRAAAGCAAGTPVDSVQLTRGALLRPSREEG